MIEDSADLRNRLVGVYTTQDVAALFGVTPMTVNLWRARGGLDAIVLPGSRIAPPRGAAGRPAVRFARRDVLSWAQRTGRRIRARSALKLAA